MSLRVTLVRTISGVLVVTIALSAILTYLHATSKVDTEVGAALELAEKTVRKSLPDIARDDDPRLELVRLVRVFDGNRHVKATFVEAAPSNTRISSSVAPADELPEWFFDLIAKPPRVVQIDLPEVLSRYGSFELETDLRGEVAEIWDDSVLKLAILSIFCALASTLVYITLGRALEPITGLSAAFERLGGGDYGARVVERGPTEIEKLCAGFNDMAHRLGDMETRNKRLNDQLATVQDEERADLARDLHDEVSPFLFSVDVDASTIRQLVQGAEADVVTSRADAIREAVAHMKKHVKSILSRLRPAVHLELGLQNAIETLVASWQLRHPEVSITADVTERGCGQRLDGVIHGIVRESLSNALKHGRPKNIAVAVNWAEDNTVVVVVRDDGGGLKPSSLSSGFGLIAMRERVEALGGSVTVANITMEALGVRAPGVEVMVRIPVRVTQPSLDEITDMDALP